MAQREGDGHNGHTYGYIQCETYSGIFVLPVSIVLTNRISLKQNDKSDNVRYRYTSQHVITRHPIRIAVLASSQQKVATAPVSENVWYNWKQSKPD